LTEAGIIFENRPAITSGIVFESAKEAQQLWKKGDKKGFQKFVLGKCKVFSSNDFALFIAIKITPYKTIWDFIVINESERTDGTWVRVPEDSDLFD
jgi:hypothetical protein